MKSLGKTIPFSIETSRPGKTWFRKQMKGRYISIVLLSGIVSLSGCKQTASDKNLHTQPNSQQIMVTEKTLQEVLDAFNRHDLDAIMEYFADDCIFEMPRGPEPWGQRYTGKDQVRKALAGRFEGIPDVHYGEDRHWASGNKGVSEWTLTGTTKTGVSIKVRGCDLWEFENGKITRKDSFWKIVEH